MVTLNSRISISKRDSGSTDYSTSSNSEMRGRLQVPDSSHGDIITVTQEQWTTPLAPASVAPNLNVSININPLSLSSLILIWGIEC